jgi:hypothetical protein
MIDLEKLHLKAVEDSTVENYYPEYSSYISESLASENTSRVTREVSVRFANFLFPHWQQNSLGQWRNTYTQKYFETTEELFDEFLKTKEWQEQ